MTMQSTFPGQIAALLMACPLACGPTPDESNEDQTWLILDVSTFDEDGSSGVLQLQARGGDAVQLRLEGGSVRDETGSAGTTLCIPVRDEVVRRLPFSLDGDKATLTAVLLEASGEVDAVGPGEDGTCQGVDSLPVHTACCILPGECGCTDDETTGSAARGDTATTTSGTGTSSTSSGTTAAETTATASDTEATDTDSGTAGKATETTTSDTDTAGSGDMTATDGTDTDTDTGDTTGGMQ